MKQSLTTEQAIDILLQDEYAGWSYSGARALVEYMEQLEEDLEQDIEMDRVALRCDYSEYKSAWEAMQQYQPDDMPTIDSEGMDLVELGEAQEAAALEWLQDRTTVITFDGGVIISQF